MLGIYKITNLINGKSYIGKSSNIIGRWEYHKTRYNNVKEWNKSLYSAFRKYGLDNFSFEILEEMDEQYYKKFGNNREEYWILYYDTYTQGYNETTGGDGGYSERALSQPRNLTEDEVRHIRQLYDDCELCLSDAYELYKDKMSHRGFQAVWSGQNYKGICPEVFSEENKQKHNQMERQRTGKLRREKKGK